MTTVITTLPLPAGLYRITTPYLCAGFVIGQAGTVTRCAPMLRRRLAYWMTVAVRISS